MSLYGNYLPKNYDDTKEYADYINESCLSGFLSPEFDEINEAYTDLLTSNSISCQDISNIVAKMESANIGSNLKLMFLENLTALYASKVGDDIVKEDTVINEYAGNAERNKIFRELLVAMEKEFAEYYKDCVYSAKELNQMFDVLVSAAKAKKVDAQKAGFAIKKIYDRVDKHFTSDEYTTNGNRYAQVYNELKKTCKKFSIKFADVVMDDKKAFDVKLKSAVKKVTNDSKLTQWLSTEKDGYNAKIKELNNAIAGLRIVSADAVKEILRYVQPVYNWTYNQLMGYIGNINYLRSILGLEKEHTTFYKIINKIFKTKTTD